MVAQLVPFCRSALSECPEWSREALIYKVGLFVLSKRLGLSMEEAQWIARTTVETLT